MPISCFCGLLYPSISKVIALIHLQLITIRSAKVHTKQGAACHGRLLDLATWRAESPSCGTYSPSNTYMIQSKDAMIWIQIEPL